MNVNAITMAWETDNDPMTAEKAIKLKAHEYIMRFKNVGISWDKSKLAAVVLVLELKQQYFKRFKGTENDIVKAISHFEKLEHDIQAY
ncbi:hypothetical protein FAM09_24885 [Niastella caeni]|uniref:Uncharacterized protein n=1 Tax=Niastella caeni TaxID=2569763 RepID=A0A4S8HGG6_9BACT|nr:hypothetical protein [Niastella caeni]THU34258.1 hypothetical protein FAM09_24885 [Niastella caeni]